MAEQAAAGDRRLTWTTMLLAQRFTKRIREAAAAKRQPQCDVEDLDSIVQARLQAASGGKPTAAVTEDDFLQAASDWLRDAETGQQASFSRVRHPCARVVQHWAYTASIEALSVAWLAMLFAEAAPGVPEDAPEAIPFRWSVGGAEAAVLGLLVADMVAQLLIELYARPCGGRWRRLRTALGLKNEATTSYRRLRGAAPPPPRRAPVELRSGAAAGGGIEMPGTVPRPPPGPPPPSPLLRADPAAMGHSRGFRARDAAVFQDKLWENVALAVLALGVAEWLGYYPLGGRFFRLSRPLRPLFLIAKSQDLRRSMAVIARTFAAIGRITSLFSILLLFYAVLGCQVFSPEQVDGYSLEGDNFGSFGASALTIFVLQSTENFPDVMYPALRQRPVVALVFFLSGLYAFAWVITPLLLAVQYEHYQTVMEAAARRQRAKSYVPMLAAYKCVARAAMLRRNREEGPAPSGSRVQVLRTDNASDQETFADFLWRAKGVRRQAARALFLALDVEQEASSDRMVTAAEFLVLPQFLRLSPQGMRANVCQQSRSCRRRPAAGCLCYSHAQRSLIREAARALVRHPVVHWLLVLAVGASAVSACWWSWPAQRRYDACVAELGRAACWSHTVMVEEYVALASLSVGVVELTLRMLASGGGTRWLSASAWNWFDVVVTGWSWASSLAIVLGAKQALPPGSTDLLEITRAARVLRVLSVVPELRDFVDFVTAGRTVNIPRTALVFAVLTVCVMISWSVVGQQLFGSIPGTATPDGQIYTFRTLGYALLDMTQVLAVNNWNSIMDAVAYRAPLGAVTTWFFVSFFFFGSMVLTNCVSGIIIDYYSIAKADAERERIQQSLFTGLGGEEDDELAAEGDGSRHGVVDPIGRIAPPNLDVAVRAAACCATADELEEDMLATGRKRSAAAPRTTADAFLALPAWLLGLALCRGSARRRWTRCCGVRLCCRRADEATLRRSRTRRLRRARSAHASFHQAPDSLLSDVASCAGVLLAPCCGRRSGASPQTVGVELRGSVQDKAGALLPAGAASSMAGPAASKLQAVPGLGRLSHKVVREYVASLREELREDIQSQSPPRLWRLLRRQRKAAIRAQRAGGAAAEAKAARRLPVATVLPVDEEDEEDEEGIDEEDEEEEDGVVEDDSDDSEEDDEPLEDGGRFVLSEAQALLLRQELGADVFDDL